MCTSDAEFTELKLQLESFMMYEGDGVESAEDVKPHEWWLAHCRSWPHLKKIAMRILAQCPTATPNECQLLCGDFVRSKVWNSL
jgi:hypothetical protein